MIYLLVHPQTGLFGNVKHIENVFETNPHYQEIESVTIVA